MSQSVVEQSTALSLMSGETYIIFNNLRGSIIIWVNCDRDLQIRLSTEEFMRTAYSIFPNLNLPELLKYLNRGEYIFTDKLSIKPLRPTEIEIQNVTPTMKDVLRSGFLKNRGSGGHFRIF